MGTTGASGRLFMGRWSDRKEEQMIERVERLKPIFTDRTSLFNHRSNSVDASGAFQNIVRDDISQVSAPLILLDNVMTR